MDYLLFSGQIFVVLVLGIGSLWLIYRRDKQNHQPIKDLLQAFGLGILVGTFLINVYNNVGYFSVFNYYAYNSKPILFINTVIIFGFINEFARFSMLWFYIRPYKKFTTPLDSVFHAYAICIGFAAAQNLIFLMEPDVSAGPFWQNSFFYFLFSLVFASIWGYAVGVYKFERKIRPVIWTFIFCFLMHGFINFCLIIEINFFWIFFILIPLIIFAFYKIQFFNSVSLKNEIEN
ncbi:PrsW family intramembrane metalloprotease [candidate division KSB1 bacterium]|nr:PrsW family intramembrane metalloprotease [candidate division KSB1 bacterium]